MITTSEKGLYVIKKYEGLLLSPYICPAGYPTIGYGHLIREDEMDLYPEITQEKADQLLKSDVKQSESAVHRLIVTSITQYQFDALVSFTFNLGAGALQASTLRRVINRGDYEEAPTQFRRWVYAGGRKLKGLIRRREEEAQLFIFHSRIK